MSVYKSLGVLVDENLTWKAHIDALEPTSLLKSSLKFRQSPTIPLENRETMYKALIVPYFAYSSCVWGYIGKGLLEKLQQLQNRAARIVTSSNYQTRSKDILDELGWEVLEYRTDETTRYSYVQNNSWYFPAVLKKYICECL